MYMLMLQDDDAQLPRVYACNFFFSAQGQGGRKEGGPDDRTDGQGQLFGYVTKYARRIGETIYGKGVGMTCASCLLYRANELASMQQLSYGICRQAHSHTDASRVKQES